MLAKCHNFSSLKSIDRLSCLYTILLARILAAISVAAYSPFIHHLIPVGSIAVKNMGHGLGHMMVTSYMFVYIQLADLETLKQSSRLVHYCATPLLFDPVFRQQIQADQQCKQEGKVKGQGVALVPIPFFHSHSHFLRMVGRRVVHWAQEDYLREIRLLPTVGLAGG